MFVWTVTARSVYIPALIGSFGHYVRLCREERWIWIGIVTSCGEGSMYAAWIRGWEGVEPFGALFCYLPWVGLRWSGLAWVELGLWSVPDIFRDSFALLSVGATRV